MDSFYNFMWDCYIKSFEISDALLESTENFSNNDKLLLVNNYLGDIKLWEKIYLNRIDYLSKHVRLNINDNLFAPEKIEFHPKFGWTFQNQSNRAYLGKSSVYEGVNINIGNHSYFSGHSTIRGTGLLTIGNYCSIAYNLYLNVSNNNHPINYPASIDFVNESRLSNDNYLLNIEYKPTIDKANFVEIGHDVWIGHNVTLFSGICIGNGCVIGAHSVVKCNCEPYGVYAGIPAKLIRYRFPEKHIIELQQIKWWDWSLEKMKRNISFFSLDLTVFDESLFTKIRE